MKNVVILGSTGSIGVNALKVLEKLGGGWRLLGISANANLKAFLKQIEKYSPEYVSLFDYRAHSRLKKIIGRKARVLAPSLEGLCEMASLKEADIVVNAVSGAVGFAPLLSSIKASKKIALANKEPMVMAGEIIMKEAFRWKARIIPVDSEPSAVFQCLDTLETATCDRHVSRIFLTASGGAFYRRRGSLKHVTPEMALKHPNWKMGAKITVDSATMMNKGLEVIEIKNFFGLDVNKIKIVVHPQSVIHSAVEFRDGSVLAQLSNPDMKLPIQYGITYPDRVKSFVRPINLFDLGRLEFARPDFKRFPCLKIAFHCARSGGPYPCILNAANETAVGAFLKRRIKFTDISRVLEKTLSKRGFSGAAFSLADVSEADSWAREKAEEIISNL